MFVAGMLMGDQDLLAVLRIRSIWKVAFLRLIVLPLVVLGILKYSGLASLVPDGESILLISLLAASAPAASNVTQIAPGLRPRGGLRQRHQCDHHAVLHRDHAPDGAAVSAVSCV